MARGLMWRVGLPTITAAVATSGIAVVINYATAWRNNVWAWVAVGVLTVASAGASVWVYLGQKDPDETRVPGTAEVNVRRQSWIRNLRTSASGHARVDIGSRSHLDTVEVTAGLQAPRADPGVASGDGKPDVM